MEPYRPNEPFIKMKLDGSLLDRLAEAGIPFARAIHYFRNNPEGSALETLKLAAEDVVPFYGNYRNGGDWSDYAKEAVMLGMPIKAPGQRGLIRVPERKINVDPERTAAIKEEFRTLADMTNNVREVDPAYGVTSDYLRQYADVDSPIPWKEEILPYLGDNMNDIVFGNTNDYARIINEIKGPGEINLNYQPQPGETTLQRMKDSKFIDGRNIADKLREWKNRYAEQGGDPNTFNEALAEYYSNAMYRPKPVTIAKRMAESGEPYNFTINELRNLEIPNEYMRNIVESDFYTPETESFFNTGREIDPEISSKIQQLYRKYTNTLSDQSISAAEKANILNELDIKLKEERRRMRDAFMNMDD